MSVLIPQVAVGESFSATRWSLSWLVLWSSQPCGALIITTRQVKRTTSTQLRPEVEPLSFAFRLRPFCPLLFGVRTDFRRRPQDTTGERPNYARLTSMIFLAGGQVLQWPIVPKAGDSLFPFCSLRSNVLVLNIHIITLITFQAMAIFLKLSTVSWGDVAAI